MPNLTFSPVPRGVAEIEKENGVVLSPSSAATSGKGGDVDLPNHARFSGNGNYGGRSPLEKILPDSSAASVGIAAEVSVVVGDSAAVYGCEDDTTTVDMSVVAPPGGVIVDTPAAAAAFGGEVGHMVDAGVQREVERESGVAEDGSGISVASRDGTDADASAMAEPGELF